MPTVKFSIDIQTNADEVAEIMADSAKIERQARAQAANRTAAAGIKDISDRLRREAGIPPKAMSKRIKLHRAKPTKPRARIFIGTRAMNVIHLRAKRTVPSGISWSGGSMGRQRSKRAFIAVSPKSGNRLVFERVPGAGRLPIRGISVNVHAAASQAARDFIRERSAGLFNQFFSEEFRKRVTAIIRRRQPQR